MTKYNERLDEIVRDAYSGEISWIHDQLEGTSLFEESLGRVDKDITNTKQAITSLIKELVAEAKPELKEVGKQIRGDMDSFLHNQEAIWSEQYVTEFEQNLLRALEEL